MPEPSKKHPWKTLLLRILAGLGSLILAALLYVTLIVAQPQQEAEKADTVRTPGQVLPVADASVQIRAETELPQLLQAFPAPVMSFMSGSGFTFVSGSCTSVPCSGGYGRKVILEWQANDGSPIRLESIYPADATELAGKENYRFSNISGPTLFMLGSVRMENDTQIRLHVQTEEGLYVITVPKSLGSSLNALVKSVQLFTL